MNAVFWRLFFFSLSHFLYSSSFLFILSAILILITMKRDLLIIFVHLENIQILLLKYPIDIVAFHQKLISKNFFKVNTAVKLFK